MAARPLLFDAVLLDLDGTIVATDLFWLDAARRGLRLAFAELGLTREAPADRDLLALVGLPLEAGFEQLLPDLAPDARATCLRRCVEEEDRALAAGAARFLPGAREGLDALRAAELRLGVASNCGQGYLDLVSASLDLPAWIEAPRCLDSPGCRTKADMLQDLCETFATRSCVMVGDRFTDGEAARDNGLPFVHVRSGVSSDDGGELADAWVHDLSELPGVLARRADWIAGALDALGVGRGARPRAIGVTGRAGAGATLWARDAARLLAATGTPATVVAAPAELDPAATLAAEAAAEGEVVLVEGPWLLDPRVRMQLDRVVYLDAPDEVRLARVAGRDGRRAGPAPVATLRDEVWPAEVAFEARCTPRAADLVLAAPSALGA